MRAELQMDSGPRLLRYVVLGAIVAAFAIGVMLLMRPGEPLQVAQGGSAGVGAAAAAMPSAVPADPATPSAADQDGASAQPSPPPAQQPAPAK